MDALVQTGKYGAINTTYITKMGCYVIKLFSEAYTIQEDTTCNGKISTAGEIFVKSQYIQCMQENTNWYREQPQQQNNIIVTKHKIVHPCLDIMLAREAKKTPNSVCNRNQ